MKKAYGYILKSLLAAYLISALMVVVLAFLFYKLEMKEDIVKGAVIGIYLMSSLAGGFLCGKLVPARRFVWGCVVGVLYFLILILLTLVIYGNLSGGMSQILIGFLACTLGGMFGGMIS